MSYRTKFIDPDYRRFPKTNRFCVRCQRDIAEGSAVRWAAFELDRSEEFIHPDDLQVAWEEIRARRHPMHFNSCIEYQEVGPECCRKVGLEWTMPDKPSVPHPAQP